MKTEKLESIGAALKWIYQFMKPHRAWLFTGIAASFVITGIDLVRAYYVKELVDYALKKETQRLLPVIVILVLVMVFGSVATYASRYATSRLGVYECRDLRQAMGDRLKDLPIPFFDEARTGDLISRVNTEVKGISGFMSFSFLHLVSLPVSFLGGVAFMLVINWKLFLVTFALVPVGMVITTKMNQRVSKIHEQAQEKKGEAMGLTHDTIEGIRVVKAFNLEAPLCRRLEQDLSRNLAIQFRRCRYEAFVQSPFGIILSHSPRILCILYGGYLVLNGLFEAGYLVAFLQLLGHVMWPLMAAYNFTWSIRLQIGIIHRISKVLDAPPERVGGQISRPDSTQDPVVAFDDVAFSYGEGERVLDRLNLTVGKGQTVALVGPSGEGKTTVMNLLCGFYTVTHGSIRVFGHDVTRWDLRALRDHIAYVSQDVYLFPGSIEENIEYGRPGASHEEVAAAAAAAHAHEFIATLPEGYATMVGERGVKLSGGERQRISIARAVLKDAPILLLDEPTASLDSQSELLVQTALQRLSQDRAVLVAAHRMSTIRQAGMILVLDRGGVVERGTHSDLMAKSGRYRELYSRQFREQEVGGTEGQEHAE